MQGFTIDMASVILAGMVAACPALSLGSDDRKILDGWVRSGRTEQRVAFRARIILKAATGLSNHAIAKALSTSRPTVIDWRNRYEQEGVHGLTHDRPRGKAFEALSKTREAAVVERTLHEKPKAATHWSCRSMAEASGVSSASVQRIWNAHGLKPHLVRTFKLSNDPHFVEKLRDVVGLYEPAGERVDPLHRREKPDSGTRPHAARSADEERPCGNDNA